MAIVRAGVPAVTADSERQRAAENPTRLPALLALLLLAAIMVITVAVTLPWQSAALGPSGSVPVDARTDFTARELARTETFYSAMRPVSYGSMALGLLVLAVLGMTSLGRRIVARAGRLTRGHWVGQVVLGALAVSVVHTLPLLPLSARAEVLLRQHGLSTQSWSGWAADTAKSFGLETGMLALAFLALYALMRRLPRWWWAPAAAGGFGLVLAISFVYPVVVEPVFNSFRPMGRGELRAQLFQLAAEDGVPVEEVLVADASRRTTAVNAYVSGFGATRRIVVYDTLLHSASRREVKLIVAHELGHAAEHDVRYGTLVGALGTAAGVCLLYLVVTSGAVTRRAGVRVVSDPGSVALLLFLVSVASTLSMPAQNLLSRQIEARADVHALNLTRDPGAYARMQRQLALRNLASLTPGLVAYHLYASHPTAPERIALARAWARGHDVPVPPPLVDRGGAEPR